MSRLRTQGKRFVPTEKIPDFNDDLDSIPEKDLSKVWGEHSIIVGTDQVRFVKTKISGVAHFSKQVPEQKRGQIIKNFLAVKDDPFGWNPSGKKKQDHLLYLLKEEPERVSERCIDIRLKREPDNEFDENAICVLLLGVNNTERTVDIGYLPKLLAESVDLKTEESIVFHYEAAKNKRNLILWMAFFSKDLITKPFVGEKVSVPEKDFEIMSINRIRKKLRVI